MKQLLVPLLVYASLGLVFAYVLGRGERDLQARVTTAALAVVAWPLWAPIALFREPVRVSREAGEGAERALAALAETHEAVRGTALEALLPESTVASMRASILRAAARLSELAATTARPEYALAAAEARLAQLDRAEGGSSTRAMATARVHLENARRLAMLRASEERALAELADLCDALRTQLVLARYAGSSLEGIGDIVSEVSARVEGLDSVLHLGPSAEAPGASLALAVDPLS